MRKGEDFSDENLPAVLPGMNLHVENKGNWVLHMIRNATYLLITYREYAT